MKIKLNYHIRKKDKNEPFSRSAKKALLHSILIFVFFLGIFFCNEPSIIRAVTDSVLVSLGITSEITISSPSDVVLSSIPGMTGGSSTSASAISWTVVTNDTAGYTLTIQEDHTLQKGGGANQSIAQYSEAVLGTPDYNWGAVGAGNEEFGFSPSSGTDVVQKFKNNGSACNTGTNVTDQKCWSPVPINPATAETIAYSGAQTSDSGTATAIKVKAEVGSGNHLEEGTFSNTITATAVTN